jgi:hypothetical protein
MSRTAALLLAIALAACSKTETNTTTDTPPAQPAAATTDTSPAATTSSSAAPSSPVCNLVTPDDLKRITTIDFKAGEGAASQGDLARCTFNRAAGAGGITITTHQSDASGLYKAMPGMAAVTGTGIGQHAWWSDQVSTFFSVNGTKTLVIAFNYPDPKNRDAAMEIAKLIVPKL